MRNRDDWIELELSKQQARLRFIDATLNGKTECDFRPRRVFFEPTNYCNLNCGHCAAHNGSMTRPQGFMDFDVFAKVMDEIQDWNRTTEINLYQHGESTLHPRFHDMIRMASVDYDFFTKLNTNGVNLNRALSERIIMANIDAVVFTIDAITPETYKAIKGRDVFYKVINNVLDFLELWGDLDREYPNYFPCDVFLVEEARNRDDIGVIRELFQELPIGHVEVYELFNYMGAVQEANEKYPERFTIPQSEWPQCNTPWDVVGIRWTGDVVSCIYDYDNRYVIGNVKEQSLWEIWNGERMQTFRQGLINRDYRCNEENGVLCSNCTIMWQKPYQVPTDFHSEVVKMKSYLANAVDRVSERFQRTDEIMARHQHLKTNREQWFQTLTNRIAPIRARYQEAAE